MAQERERREGSSHSIDAGKRGRGLLSFRSRKLLSSFSKRNDENEVSKLAVVAPQTLSIQPILNEILGKEVVPDERPKASRELWNPRKVESGAAGAKSKGRKTKKQQQQLPVKDKELEEGKDRAVVAPSKQHLSPKLKLLETFYEGLEVASSLLRIRHQMCTFKAVCKIVESMSKRRFLLKHLAQIKHVFFEVLQLEYVRCQDPDSWGEKWDLRITLLPFSSDCTHSNSPLKGSAGQTGATVRRRKEFRARLLKIARIQEEVTTFQPCELPSARLDVEIPQGTLPARPLGGQLTHIAGEGQPASSSKRLILESASERSPNAQSPKFGAEEFHFSIVRPSRASAPTLMSEGTSHFPASFRPFFSATHSSESGDGVAGQVSNSDGTPAHGSHFPASWRPFFSVQRTAEAVDITPVDLPKTLQPDEIVPRVSCGVTESGVESGDGEFPSSPGSSALLETTSSSHFPLSFTPSFSLSSKNLPEVSISVESTPKRLHDDSPASLVPIHTPCVSSVNNSSRTAQDSLKLRTPANSLSHSLPPKSQGIMRSLRFGSPVRSSAPDIASSIPSVSSPPITSSPLDKSEARYVQTSPSIGPSTPAQPFPSDLSNSVEASSPFTPPNTALQDKSSLLSAAKPSKSRSLQFNTPPKARGINNTNPPGGTNPGGRDLCTPPSAAAAKPPNFVRRPGSLMSSSPQTPGLQTPVRTSNPKEALYSPPKRAKLSRVSLFAKGREDKDHEITSVLVPGDVCGTRSNLEGDVCGMKSFLEVIDPIAANVCQQESLTLPKAQSFSSDVCQQESLTLPKAQSFAADGRQQVSSAPPKLQSYPAVKNMRGMSQSDLDILQCLPLDLVQSVQEKERKLKDESSRDVAKQKRRQQMMSGVPKLFNQLRLIFQSVNRSVLHQHELVKSILSSHPDMTDKGEVEERLQLIIELAPDYITRRPSLSGEPLYRIEKRANVVQIQRRLSGAC